MPQATTLPLIVASVTGFAMVKYFKIFTWLLSLKWINVVFPLLLFSLYLLHKHKYMIIAFLCIYCPRYSYHHHISRRRASETRHSYQVIRPSWSPFENLIDIVIFNAIYENFF